MLAIDTDVVVRYLTNDHPQQSPRARTLIDDEAVFVPVTVVLEVEWVLRSAYDHPAADVIRALRAFAGLPMVSIEDADAVASALELATQGLDFADALHLSRSGRCDAFVTFDRRLAKAAGKAGSTPVREA